MPPLTALSTGDCRGLCFNHVHASQTSPRKIRKKRRIRVEQKGRKRIRSCKTILGTDIKRRFGSMSRPVYARKPAEWPDKKSNDSKMQDTSKKALVMIDREQK